MLKRVLLGLVVSAVALMAAGGAQAADMSCKGKNFVFFPGGPEGGSFASILYNGAQLAAEQTGCNVEYVWSDWNPQKMVEQFSQAIARKPTGIAMVGHPGGDALGPLIDRAREAGIIVTTQNVALPRYEAEYAAKGFGYVGAKNYTAGVKLAKAMLSGCDLKKDDKVLVWGLLAQGARGQRTKGVKETLEKAGVDVAYLEISDSVNKDAAQGIPTFAAFAAANQDMKGVVTDHGGLTATLPSYLKAANKKADDLCAAGFDLSASTAQAIQDGYVTMVLDQQPFLQGYLPIIQLYLTSKFGFAGMDIDTGAAIITKDNVAEAAELAKEGIR